ncbi:MAG: hypothetical protein RMK65_06580 [Anaerolineae bacterium]|nr:hypothetical protein [Anaerolineae bacterium]MDW7991790.1 hypothetical protein [Anaerolineae bacterium]
MSKWTREKLLEGLAQIAPLGMKAEAIDPNRLLRMTFPVPAHLHALEPDVLLIIGGRGAGKTHLFRAINLPNGPGILGYRGRASGAIWITGFSVQPPISVQPPYEPTPLRFPGETVLQRFAAEHRSRTDLMDFWLGLLLGTVLAQEERVGEPLIQVVRNQLSGDIETALRDLKKVGDWFPVTVQSLEKVEAALDALDDKLSQNNQYLIVTYDDLDVMAVEWEQKRALLQALFQLWLGLWRRWRRIRPKIFLRRDLFSPEFLQFPDASKIEGHKYELRWSPPMLYGLVFKLWANQNEDSRWFLEESGLPFVEDPNLGWTYPDYKLPSEEVLRKVVHRLIGPFMGKGPKKGRSFEWIPNHLQDANGEIVPRSIIHLFSEAAKYTQARPEETAEAIIPPTAFAASLEKASNQRIQELLEEYPWLEKVRVVLKGQHVPIPQEQLAALLQPIDWEGGPQPPFKDADMLIYYMIKIGILYLTLDKRIHVPDIYLYGFGLKRKGGIRRPAFEMNF